MYVSKMQITKPLPIKIMDKVVGVLRPDRVFITYRTDLHFFRKYNGFGLSYSVLKKILDLNCRKVIILWEKDNGTTEKLQTYPKRFIEEGELWKDGERDYQRILPIHKLQKKTMQEVIAV